MKIDPFWKYADEVLRPKQQKDYYSVDPESKKMVQCKLCGWEVGRITRLKHHLAKLEGGDVGGCENVTPEIKREARDYITEIQKRKRKKITIEERRKKAADFAVINWLKQSKIPLSMLSSVTFREACDAIKRAGHGYEPPENEKVGEFLSLKLHNYSDIKTYEDAVKESCKSSGCTLLLTDSSILDVDDALALVCTSVGTIFLTLLDYDITEEDDYNFRSVFSKFLKEVGPRNVVRCVLEDASDYRTLLKKSIPKSVIVLPPERYLSDILENLRQTSLCAKAKKTEDFFKSSSKTVNDWMSQFIERENFQLFDFKLENFLLFIKQKDKLREMIRSSDWQASDWCNSTDGDTVKSIISDEDNTFWIHVEHLSLLSAPIIALEERDQYDARFVGLLYKLQDYLLREKSIGYSNDLGEIIWSDEGKKDRALFATVAYLNPYLSSYGYKMDEEGDHLNIIIESLVFDEEDRKTVREQLEAYHRKDPNVFGVEAFKEDQDNVYEDPGTWWEQFGVNVPKLKQMAMTILSQPFCASSLWQTVDNCVDLNELYKWLNLKPGDLEWRCDVMWTVFNEGFMNDYREKVQTSPAATPISEAPSNADFKMESLMPEDDHIGQQAGQRMQPPLSTGVNNASQHSQVEVDVGAREEGEMELRGGKA